MAMAFLATTRDASAVERKGFIAGIGIGGGKITCSDCESKSGTAVALHLGGMLTEKVALVLGLSVVSTDDNDLTSSVASAAVQYFVSPKVWVKGGIASVLLEVNGKGSYASNTGGGFQGGLGVEVVQKKRFAIDLQVRFTTAKIEGERTNNVMALLGFNLY